MNHITRRNTSLHMNKQLEYRLTKTKIMSRPNSFAIVYLPVKTTRRNIINHYISILYHFLLSIKEILRRNAYKVNLPTLMFRLRWDTFQLLKFEMTTKIFILYTK